MLINIPHDIRGEARDIKPYELTLPWHEKLTENGLILIPKNPPAPKIESYIKIK